MTDVSVPPNAVPVALSFVAKDAAGGIARLLARTMNVSLIG